MREACDADPRGEECARLRRELRDCEQRARIEGAIAAVSRSVAARAAMEYADCRRAGGTMEECLGVFRAAPIARPGDPVLQDELNALPSSERRDVLLLLREALVAQVRQADRLLGRG
jgi:hypothetical protein